MLLYSRGQWRSCRMANEYLKLAIMGGGSNSVCTTTIPCSLPVHVTESYAYPVSPESRRGKPVFSSIHDSSRFIGAFDGEEDIRRHWEVALSRGKNVMTILSCSRTCRLGPKLLGTCAVKMVGITRCKRSVSQGTHIYLPYSSCNTIVWDFL